jgi:hypothetical protein
MKHTLFQTGLAVALTMVASQTMAQTIDPRFLQALEDSAIAEPSEVSNSLVSLATGNPAIVERTQGDLREIKVAAFMSQQAMESYYSAPQGTLPPGKAILWVTAVPQLKTFCSGLGKSGAPLLQRLAYWLGLPPGASHNRLVELWVPADALFRPCADPTTSGTTCPAIAQAPSGPVAGMADYASFYANLFVQSYSTQGAPWTHLGYTYDWAPTATSEQGASEFMVGPSTPYEVAGRYTLDAYCQP